VIIATSVFVHVVVVATVVVVAIHKEFLIQKIFDFGILYHSND